MRNLRMARLVSGPMNNNTYVLIASEEEDSPALVIDPFNAEEVLDLLEMHPVAGILLTHHHYDHVYGLHELAARTDAPVLAHALDADAIEGTQRVGFDGSMLPGTPVTHRLKDNDRLAFGDEEFQVIHTPGHTPGGVCLYIPAQSNDESPFLFSGDTLFRGTTGRTDFEGGSVEQMRESLQEKLALLPNDTVVFPGHEDPTTIGDERERTIEAF